MIEIAGYRIEVTERANCKRMILHHKPGENYFRLSVPRRTRQKDVIAFLQSQVGWMETMMQRARATEWQPRYEAGERHLAYGQWVTLGQNGVPVGRQFLNWRAQLLHDAVVRLLPAWQQRMGVHASRIRWRDMTSRWGSCKPSTGDITLNLRLGMMTEAMIEYVLVHELNHLRHPDHSPAFHADMTMLMPDWKVRKAQLNALAAESRPQPSV